MHDSKIHTFPMNGPDDVSGLEALLDSGEFEPDEIQGIMLNHEGHLWAKGYTQLAFSMMLAERTGRPAREIMATLPFQALAGIAGFMVPHGAVFVRREVNGGAPTGEKRLAIAGRCTAEISLHATGSAENILEVSRTITSLAAEIGVDDMDDVPFVFVKAPWCTQVELDEAIACGEVVPAPDAWSIGDHSRAAAALGIAHALGEVTTEQIAEGVKACDRASLYTRRGQVSSGEERRSNAVVVFANSTQSCSASRVASGVLEDGLDTEGAKSVLRKLGFEFDCCPARADLERVEYAFLKPNTSGVKTLRGHRHTLESDLILGPYWWMVDKAPIHGAISALLGTPLMSVATGSEHQGAPGQPLLSIVARVD
jgi:cyanuric acid amidohydrolase